MDEFATWLLGQIPALIAVVAALGFLACLLLLVVMGVMAMVFAIGELIGDRRRLKEAERRKEAGE